MPIKTLCLTSAWTSVKCYIDTLPSPSESVLLLRSAEVPYARIPPLGPTLSRPSAAHNIVPRKKHCNVIQSSVRVLMPS
jgi:hypothetical protein